MKLFGIVISTFVLAASLFASGPVAEEGRSRFCVVDIVADSSSTPLAAYQVEFAVTNVAARIVGIEGGEHPAFAPAPAYDPAAMQQERVILAAFSLRPARELPAGPTRIATIHLEVRADADPECLVQAMAAGDAEGKRIKLNVSCKQRIP